MSRVEEREGGMRVRVIRLLYSYNSLRVIDRRCCFTEFSYRTNSRCCCAVFYSQLTSKVIHARSVQAVVYLERHVVSFEYFVSSSTRNNRLYITPPRFRWFVRTKGILGNAWCYRFQTVNQTVLQVTIQYIKIEKQGGRMFIVSRDRPEMDANLIDFNWIIFIYKNRRGGAGGGGSIGDSKVSYSLCFCHRPRTGWV